MADRIGMVKMGDLGFINLRRVEPITVVILAIIFPDTNQSAILFYKIIAGFWRTRVVVLQVLLILVAFIDCDSGRFGDALLLLQRLDDFIRVHIFGRDRLLEVCYDLIGQRGFAGDLEITNKKLFILCQRRKDLFLDAR